jgi:hypothetical protein
MSDSVISVENLGKRAGVIAPDTRSKVECIAPRPPSRSACPTRSTRADHSAMSLPENGNAEWLKF